MKHETNHVHAHPQKSQQPGSPSPEKPADQLSGPQGVDKSPGDDTADDPNKGLSVAETQKAKKVDEDPTEADKKGG